MPNSVKPTTKKILYIDLDNTLVNFQSGIDRLTDNVREKFKDDLDEAPHIFSRMDPVDGAIEAYHQLAEQFDTYILSTAPWKNATAWHDKVLWVQEHLGMEEGSVAYKRLILSHHKHLNRGDYLIDDRLANGAGQFQGTLIKFGSAEFPNWQTVTDYLAKRA